MSSKPLSQPNWHDYVEERLSAYIDGELSESERNEVRRHLNECPRCQASLDSLGWTIKLVKQLPAPPLPRQFTLPVPEPARAPARAGWLRWGLAAASGLAVLILAVFISAELLRPSTGNTPSAAYVPQAAPAQPTAAAKVAATTAPALDNSQPAGAAESSIPTVTPPATNVAVMSAPAAATAAPAATQAPRALQPQPTVTAQRPRTTTRANAPTPTPICEYGCGGGPDTAPPGMGAGAAPTQEPTVGALQAPAQAQLAALPTVVTTGTVNTAELNVRAEPNEAAALLGLLYRNQTVEVVGRDDSARWIAIQFHLENQADRQAWVIANSIVLTVPIYDLPIIMQPPAETPTPTPAGMANNPPEPTAEQTIFPAPKPSAEPTLAVEQPTPTAAPPTVAVPQPTPTAAATMASTGPTGTPMPSNR